MSIQICGLGAEVVGQLLVQFLSQSDAHSRRHLTGPVLRESILNEMPSPTREVSPWLLAELEEIIKKALEKDLNLRYQSAAEMRA